jgi:hypothetical protein
MQLVSSAPGVEDVAAMPLGAAMRRLLSHADQQAAQLSCKAFAAALDPHISVILVDMNGASQTCSSSSSSSSRLLYVTGLRATVSHSSQWRTLQELASKLPSLSHLAVNVMEEAAEQP